MLDNSYMSETSTPETLTNQTRTTLNLLKKMEDDAGWAAIEPLVHALPVLSRRCLAEVLLEDEADGILEPTETHRMFLDHVANGITWEKVMLRSFGFIVPESYPR
jgi:hypothetical protein